MSCEAKVSLPGVRGGGGGAGGVYVDLVEEAEVGAGGSVWWP